MMLTMVSLFTRLAEIEEKKKAIAAIPAPRLLVPETSLDLTAPDRNGVVLNEQQQSAIATAMTHKYSVLIGYAGTGKTTTVKRLVQTLTEKYNDPDAKDNQGYKPRIVFPHLSNLPPNALPFAMCAFTGLAVKQMRNAVTSHQHDDYDYAGHCYTIHKLLDYGPDMEEVWDETQQEYYSRKVMLPKRDRNNRLTGLKLLIIDEVSMLGENLAYELFQALPDDCKIVAVGDLAQLPPVFGRAVMPLMLQQWPVSELTKVYRQEEGSLIDNANRIRIGEKPHFNERFKALTVQREAKPAQREVITTIVQNFNTGVYDPKQDIILTPNNTGQLGQEKLNILLRSFLNKEGSKNLKAVRTMKRTLHFSIGDRVMCKKNNADKDIFNGMLGWIVDIKVAEGMRKFDTNGNEITNEAEAAIDINAAMLSILSDINAEQEKKKQFNEQTSLLTTSDAMHMVPGFEQAASSNQDDDEGTSERKASHVITVAFDPIDKDAEPLIVDLWTSSEIENLILAWVITVHKAQGSGFRNVYVCLHESAGKLLRNELLYTAVTRCISSVKILTTKLAFNRCLNQFHIPGKSLQEKIHNYTVMEKNKQLVNPKHKRIIIPVEGQNYNQQVKALENIT